MNPYQSQLANELNNEDKIKVCFSNDYSFFGLLKVYYNSKFNLIHIHWLDQFILHNNKTLMSLKSFNFLLQILFLKINNVKIVWTVHNIVNHDKTNLKLQLRVLKLFSKLVDLHIFHAEPEKNILNDFKHKKIAVINHPSYYGLYNTNISEIDARKKLGIPPKSYVFSFIGHIKEYKGVLDLIIAFKSKRFENSYLLIAGLVDNDNLLHEIRNLVESESNIIFKNEFIPDDELQIFFNSSDLVVFPFKNILTSGSVLLAQSFGKPVLIPKVASLISNLNSIGTFTYEYNDANGLEQAMNEAYLKGQVFNKNTKKNLEDWSKQNSWKNFALKTQLFYSKL